METSERKNRLKAERNCDKTSQNDEEEKNQWGTSRKPMAAKQIISKSSSH